MTTEYRIEGKCDEDYTGDYLYRLLEEFYITKNGVETLMESVNTSERIIYYIRVKDKSIEEKLDKIISEINKDHYGVIIEKLSVDDSDRRCSKTSVKIKPERYDMTNEADVKRWFREMEGYLKTEDFLNQGTDREGRVFAMDAFRQLRVIMYKKFEKS